MFAFYLYLAVGIGIVSLNIALSWDNFYRGNILIRILPLIPFTLFWPITLALCFHQRRYIAEVLLRAGKR